MSEDVEERIAQLRAAHTVERRLDEVLSTKLRRRAAGVEVTALDPGDVRGRLEAFLRERLDGEFTVSDVARLSGGAANAQFSFGLAFEDEGGRREERMVLRVKATAAIVETDIEREFQLQRAAHGVIPVPEPFWATGEREHFGEPAMISGFVTGVPAPTKDVPKATGLGTAYGSRLRELIAPQFVSHLAALHAHDFSGEDLGLFDVPAAGSTEAIDLRLGLWDRVWDEDRIEVHPTVTLTQQWLRERRPAADRISLVHGDYRNGNFLFDEASGELTSILDWELGYLGDRHSDLGYAMLPGWGHPDDAGDYLCSGLMEREAFIAQYERESGLAVDRERLEYYVVLNLYWAVVALYGSGPRIAVQRQTHLGVMMNFIAGLGGYFISELNAVLAKD